MSKDSHFTGQPVYSQVLKLLDKEKILQISCETKGSEAYVKGFDGYQHLVVMLFGILKHFDSLREVVSLKVCNSSFLSLYFHCYFILFFPVFELIYSPFICRLCFLHRHGCQEEDDRLL